MSDTLPDSSQPIPQSPATHNAKQSAQLSQADRLKTPPITLLLRPQSAVTEQHLGLLSFHVGGPASVGIDAPGTPDAMAIRADGHSTIPTICLLAFKRFDWQPGDVGLLRFLGDVVQWARAQSLPPPTQICDLKPGHAMAARAAAQTVNTSIRVTPLQPQADDPFPPRAVWVLVRDVATAYVVAVNDRSRRVTLLPCPSILPGIPQGSLDAASTWLPPRWFTLHSLALMRPLRDLPPSTFQLPLDFG